MMLRTAFQRSALLRSSQVYQRRTFTSRDEVNQALKLVEKDAKGFLEKYVADDVLWTVTEPKGRSTPISGELLT